MADVFRRILIVAVLVAMAGPVTLGQLLPPAPAPSAPPGLMAAFGTFYRVASGWICNFANPQQLPPFLADLRREDVLVSLGGVSVKDAGPLQLLGLFRRAELGLVDSAVILRGGERRVLPAADSARPAPAGLAYATQDSLVVLGGADRRLAAGDILLSLNGKPLKSLMARFGDAPPAVVDVKISTGSLLGASRNGNEVTIRAAADTSLYLVQLPDLTPAGKELVDSSVLRGLNTTDIRVSSQRGRWLLLHFWATWCHPCMVDMPVIRELAEQKNLTIAGIGFADSIERLRAFGAGEKAFKVFAPDPALAQQLGIKGIPFDILLDPDGNAVLIISGVLPLEQLKPSLMRFLQPAP